MKLGTSLFFVLITNTILAQESPRTQLNGKISANTIDLEGIYVINIKTEKSAITKKNGYFSIAATPGDSLLFSAIHLKEIRIALEAKNFQEEFIIKMVPTTTQLNEVVIKRYDNINAVALGISPRGIKHLTQAERHLKTATDLNPTPNSNGMAGGSVSLEPILNLLSGRTAMLKKAVEVEKKLHFIAQIDKMFDQNYFVNILKIPLDYVSGFKYYMVENTSFTPVLKTKNKATIEFLMGQLAEKYKETIASEK